MLFRSYTGFGAFLTRVPAAARSCAKRSKSCVERGSPPSLSERGCRLQFLAYRYPDHPELEAQAAQRAKGQAPQTAIQMQGIGGGTLTRLGSEESRALHIRTRTRVRAERHRKYRSER